ncbi:hypothetical protein DFJ63DRAFT_337399 [Scheffersomyces coipomensis]|uniref:uncharacterized protein n=1 Tax=Scheffersomyces coipomensis TaxID=1788519 RepID=UPI00315DB91C
MDDIVENGGERRSATEPSTPLRNIVTTDSQSGNYTNPTHSTSIHLPPNELTEVTKRLSQQFRSSIIRPRSRTRVRQSTPGRDKQLTPTRSNGNRRASEVIRRRRSSMITDKGEVVYGSEYAGPITIDYLRFFCKVVIKQQEHDIHEKESNVEEDHFSPQVPKYSPPKNNSFESPFIDADSTPKPTTDFDQSLPLPSSTEKVLKSPFQILSNLDDSGNFTPTNTRRKSSNLSYSTDKENGEVASKPLSYLEKILLSKRLKRKSDTIKPIENSVLQPHEQEIYSPVKSEFIIHSDRENKEVSPSVLDDHHHLPISAMDAQSEEMDFHIAYDVLENQVQDFNDDIDDHDIERDHIPGLTHTNDVPESPVQVHDQVQLPISPMVTPQNAGVDFNNGFYPEAIIQEEFTMQDEPGNYSDLLERDASIEADGGSSEVDAVEGDKLIKIPTIRSSTVRSSKSLLPLSSVKNLVKSIRIHASRDDHTNRITKKQKVLKTIPQDVYQNIQAKSDQFLKSLLSDLEAYSHHRSNGKSSQINMKDISLYLNRIKFAGKTGSRDSEINKISVLAQNFLPLELLLQLNNSLNGQLERTSNDDDEDEDMYDDNSYDDSV